MTDKPQATGPLTSLDRDTRALEKEIERRGVILGIDWNDAAQVRALAEEALSHGRDASRQAAHGGKDHQAQAKAELFGFAALMLRTMAISAEEGFFTHGGVAWKAFGKALWEVSGLDGDGPAA